MSDNDNKSPDTDEETDENQSNSESQANDGDQSTEPQVLKTSDIVDFIGSKTAEATNPFVASAIVGAATAVDFLITHFNDGKKKKKKKKKNKKNKGT